MKVKVSEATPVQINYLVGACEGLHWEEGDIFAGAYGPGFAPATDWSHAGPIIEREFIQLGGGITNNEPRWFAFRVKGDSASAPRGHGPTPLIAAMRCYVASKLGDECDIPNELMKEDKPDWRDPNSGCYCVVCLAPVREDIFVQRGGCCPNHKFDDECTYR